MKTNLTKHVPVDPIAHARQPLGSKASGAGASVPLTTT